MELIDTHCHLEAAACAADLPEVLGQARAHGVTGVVAVGVSPADFPAQCRAMATGIDLPPFWELLETNFPLAGPRCDLRKLLGRELVAALEAGGHISYLRVADTVACPHPGGSGCPAAHA